GLSELNLSENRLTGPIPAELHAVANLRTLRLSGNHLTGLIPAWLGDLANLAILNLGGNELSGPLPAELGRATMLDDLDVRSNSLAGTVPPEFSNLSRLGSLILADNPALAGPLPPGIVALDRLERFMAGGTGLCRPADVHFDTWFRSIADRRAASCRDGATAYLTQAVQSWDDPVPLLAGRSALLRVFVTAPNGGGATMPAVRASFYVDGNERHALDIAAGTQTIPSEIVEGDLALSANAEVPAWVLVPGLEMVIEVDPDGTLDPSLGVTKRIPETGRMAVDVRRVPPFSLTIIPFLWETEPDSSIVETVSAMAADPDGHELLRGVRRLFPITGLDVAGRKPVVSSWTDPARLLGQVHAMRLMEGGSGHWMGLVDHGRPRGIAGSRISVSFADARIIAHELGHNLSLGHAPCGTWADSNDPWFPHINGTTGAWGYDFERGTLVPPHATDVMSYCTHIDYWISDFFFNKTLAHRLASADAEVVAATHTTRTLLLWGGRDEDGVPYLDPAFVVDAVPSLPTGGGDYRIEAAGPDGTPIFSFNFDMPVNPDAEGDETSFVFALPVQAGWANLVSITLSGPGGSVLLDGTTEQPMAILRDSGTGQVRAFLRDPAPLTQAAADAAGQGAGPGMEVLFSRGIPGAEAWRR
ncbi:MAG: M66 family metalloprotease, partial [Gemmatimonadota bacterium]|nr:M66 family metalloprotease [Gemmatimonadota bacterium]